MATGVTVATVARAVIAATGVTVVIVRVASRVSPARAAKGRALTRLRPVTRLPTTGPALSLVPSKSQRVARPIRHLMVLTPKPSAPHEGY
jgi:hypothetical protein